MKLQMEGGTAMANMLIKRIRIHMPKLDRKCCGFCYEKE